MNKIILLLLVALFLLPLAVQGDVLDDLNRQISAQEAKRIELERQAQEYQAIINQKKGEIKTLNNQVAIFNAQINKLQIEINITEDDIDQTKLEILQLEYGIDQTEGDIVFQRSNLGQIIQVISEFDQTSQMEMILSSDDFSDFFNQLAYLDNLQNGVKEKVGQLKFLKEKLNNNKESEEQKKERLEESKKQLDNQKWSLASQRKTKQDLVSYTKGEESKYQQMLANIETQKKELLGDINQLRQQKAEELARLKELQEKPPSQYWASLNWYYSQDDPRWAKTTIGISNYVMENWGCAVTSVAMVFSSHNNIVTPGQLAKASIFVGALIDWPKSWGSVSCTNCPPPHVSSFDWFKLDRELGAGYPVVIYIKAVGRGGGHYVVVHHKTNDGRYVVHDPLFGANIYLESTQVYISNLYETTTKIDQMIIYH